MRHTKQKKRKKPATTAHVASKRVRKAARSITRATTRASKQVKRAVTRASRPPRARAVAGQADAVALLKADHREMRQLLEQLKGADSPDSSRRAKLLERVEDALKTHTTIEEEIFYPAFRDAAATKKDRQLFFEAVEEHHAVDTILPEVARATNEPDVFVARAKVLKELVEHHAEEEETDMFPRARKLFPPSELRRLGAEMAARKRSLHRSSGPLGVVAQLFSS
jgi:hemerythrin-like domain-containing protein